MSRLFLEPPEIKFRTLQNECPHCGVILNVQKTIIRQVSTLHLGSFAAAETIMVCPECNALFRAEELAALVPPGANFGYDVMVHVGRAMLERHRNEAEIVDELALENVQISPREVSLLANKFIVYLSLCHQESCPDLVIEMQQRGGYILHLDATTDGGSPMLMSSIDSLSKMVLGNVKLPSESEAYIVPFLERIKLRFGTPLALVHDMGKGILKAVNTVFPSVADFICHFHFLRDIGKDYLGDEYDTIRKRLSKHAAGSTLRYRAKQLKTVIDADPKQMELFEKSIHNADLPSETLESIAAFNVYSMIQWALQGKSEGNGYGFPFDRSHLAYAKRIRQVSSDLEEIKNIHLRGDWKDNKPYHKLYNDLKPIMNDKSLWAAVEALERKIVPFDQLREAMRIAQPTGRKALNDEGEQLSIATIEKRVKKFRDKRVKQKGYPQNQADQKMVKQIDKYWEKLFADPIPAQTPSGPVLIQPQRTNNILEQFFRQIKRGHRRRTGNASSSRILRTLLAETPLVRNLGNPDYMKILLREKATLADRFSEIEIGTLRNAFREAQETPEKIPAPIKAMISKPDFTKKIVNMIKRAAA